MIKGLRTVLYPAPDLARAKEWYASVFESPPYFDQPFYVGFEIGGFELGLLPDAAVGTAGVRALWGVENLEGELARLKALGISPIDGIQEVGEGIKVAEIKDPCGNIVGLIENPHFNTSKVR